jgi:hypothetical protein
MKGSKKERKKAYTQKKKAKEIEGPMKGNHFLRYTLHNNSQNGTTNPKTLRMNMIYE